MRRPASRIAATWAALAGAAVIAAPARAVEAAAVATSAADAAPAELRWNEAFAVDAAAGDAHVRLRYRGTDGQWHRLELWRRGETFAHRRTDDRLDLYVSQEAGAAGHYRYRVLDQRRRALVEVDRANLFRIGVFSDWASLAYLMRTPASPMRVTRLAHAPVDLAPALACDWYRVTPATASTPGPAGANDVCWSRRWAVPVRIESVDAGGHPMSVMEVDDATAGMPDDAGFGLPSLPADWHYVDANSDIDPTSD